MVVVRIYQHVVMVASVLLVYLVKLMAKPRKKLGCCTGCCGYLLLCLGCCCLVHKPARIRFRETYGLEEGSGCASDFCATWCCSVCGVCQEARERKSQGKESDAVMIFDIYFLY